MSIQKNPFVDLYVTERISEDVFVKVFSSALLNEADTLALYQPGNVILMGLQGSGKTALLNLLRPEVLSAYLRAGVQWPLPEHCSKFLSAGINLSKSGALDFGQRQVEPISEDRSQRLALFFADFLNYWVVDDLLQSLETVCSEKNIDAGRFLGIERNSSALDRFATDLAKNKCWLRGLANVDNYKSLRESLEGRIIDYRNYLNFNTDGVPEHIEKSKTSAGEPISVAVEMLRKYRLIPEDLPVFIRIDQFEELLGLEYASDATNSVEYRAVIFKMLGTRDSRVSYRVGARPYAVQQDFKMLGTTSAIEELRNYTIVDIDYILRRKEHNRGIFPKFAEDVFLKRLREADYQVEGHEGSLISNVFGSRPSPDERAKAYLRDVSTNLITDGHDWPSGASEFLNNLARESPLSAKLGEAWVRQQVSRGGVTLSQVKDMIWEQPIKKWWRKERIEQALLQIAASRKQRMLWKGDRDVIALSGGNILVFLSICQLVWSEHLRSGKGAKSGLPQISSGIVQDLGMQQASEYWFRKLRADPNGGDDRHRFLAYLASELRAGMRDDRNMSYPGANGFSLSDRELDANPDVGVFLDLCTAYGVLTVSRHTPKTASRGQSKKWYLFPIFSPHFQLPAAHTKEPIYLTVAKLREWLACSNVDLKQVVVEKKHSGLSRREANTAQLSLFHGRERDDQK